MKTFILLFFNIVFQTHLLSIAPIEPMKKRDPLPSEPEYFFQFGGYRYTLSSIAPVAKAGGGIKIVLVSDELVNGKHLIFSFNERLGSKKKLREAEYFRIFISSDRTYQKDGSIQYVKIRIQIRGYRHDSETFKKDSELMFFPPKPEPKPKVPEKKEEKKEEKKKSSPEKERRSTREREESLISFLSQRNAGIFYN